MFDDERTETVKTDTGNDVRLKYLKGECTYDEENWCPDPHPEELSSDCRPHEDLNDFEVSDVRSQACMTCLDRSVPCDKIGRASGKEDPCSECRHFGGENAHCVLAADVSHNDRLWRQMMGRFRKGYTLPAYKPRDAQRKKKGKPFLLQPMKDEDLVTGWSGKEKEELLKLGDMLRDDIRARPRAYVNPAATGTDGEGDSESESDSGSEVSDDSFRYRR